MTMTPWLLEGKVQILSISNFSKVGHLKSNCNPEYQPFHQLERWYWKSLIIHLLLVVVFIWSYQCKMSSEYLYASVALNELTSSLWWNNTNAFEDKRQFENTHAEFHSKNNKRSQWQPVLYFVLDRHSKTNTSFPRVIMISLNLRVTNYVCQAELLGFVASPVCITCRR